MDGLTLESSVTGGQDRVNAVIYFRGRLERGMDDGVGDKWGSVRLGIETKSGKQTHRAERKRERKKRS